MGIKCENPAINVGEAMKKVPKAKRYPTLTDVNDIRRFLAIIDDAGASPVTRLLLACYSAGLTLPRVGCAAPWNGSPC
ncbi:hypothetical protein [Novosphingopyxis baekryungensis]|uniref:hypothetical protein n=1 Tax=Novosphingopyxis baekryungensis TaxID=279369 RepID=UPI0013A5A38C|nr:hypothetical protein [Novosphingopyxis baekryungensis]